jgi:hypothetical protein
MAISRFARAGPCGLARDAPTAALLCTMFADFLTENGDKPLGLTATGEIDPVHGAAYAEDAFSGTRGAIWPHTPRPQILRNGTGMRLNGPGELLTTLLPPSHMISVLSTGGQWTPIS